MTVPPSRPSNVQLRASASPGELRVVAVRDGILLDYAISRLGAPDGVGDRIRGRVVAHLPAMAGAFVALPDGIEGFLPDSHGAAVLGVVLGVGDAVTVCITRAAQGGKGPRLTARTPQTGPGPPELLTRGPDALARLQALHPDAPVFVDDPAAAIPGATIVRGGWDEALDAAVADLATPMLDLPGGLRASIHPTPALVAIDLDGGASSSERRAKAGAQREANRAALPALAHAIRLRNLSGAIVLDLAGMAVKARAALAPDLVAALAPDPLHPRFLGFTALGLAEILRPRIYPPLHEVLSGPHAAALRALRHLAREAAADPATPLRLRTAPDVARALDGDPAARTDLARRTGRALVVISDPACPPGRWTLESIPRG